MTYNILIVDDQREVTRMLRSGINTLGDDFFVVDVLSGEEAQLEARLKKYDVLVADVRLPGISGLELMGKMKIRNPELKVVLITGLTSTKVRRQVADAGADAFFLKPIQLPDFLDALERLLGLEPEPAGMIFDSVGLDTEPGLILQQDPDIVALFDEEMPDNRGISERLADIRISLEAISAILLNDRGEVLVQAGDLPDAGIESSLIPSLMSAFSASQKISHFLGMTTPQNMLLFSGSKYDLIMSLVGRSYALLLVADNVADPDMTAKYADLIRKTVDEMMGVLAEMGVPLSMEEEVTQIVPPFEPVVEIFEEEKVEETDDELDELFNNASEGLYEVEDADDFWDPAAEESTSNLNPDALSYDQALQLGIAPNEE